MAEKKAEKHALYLMPFKDGQYDRAQLVHADDVEDRMKEGWREPIGQKANGAKWNDEDDLAGQDAAAESAKLSAELTAKKNAKKAEEAEAARKEAEKNAVPPQERPDMKVQIVEAPKPDAKANAKK
jgi:hypothetical protein